MIYLSDNGFLYGEHRRTGKNDPWEESVNVPMVVRYPAALARQPRVHERRARPERGHRLDDRSTPSASRGAATASRSSRSIERKKRDGADGRPDRAVPRCVPRDPGLLGLRVQRRPRHDSRLPGCDHAALQVRRVRRRLAPAHRSAEGSARVPRPLEEPPGRRAPAPDGVQAPRAHAAAAADDDRDRSRRRGLLACRPVLVLLAIALRDLPMPSGSAAASPSRGVRARVGSPRSTISPTAVTGSRWRASRRADSIDPTPASRSFTVSSTRSRGLARRPPACVGRPPPARRSPTPARCPAPSSNAAWSR